MNGPAPEAQKQPQTQTAKSVPQIALKLYAFMPKLLPILFAVFAVLMMICYAGAIESSELLEELGGTSDSVYSVLSTKLEQNLDDDTESGWEDLAEDEFFGEAEEMTDGASTTKNIAAALVAFGALSLAVAALGLAFSLYVPLRSKAIKIGDRKLKVTRILDIAELTLLFAIFLLGCILCGNAGDELGLSKPGAAPICIIFFSLFFGSLMVATLFGRKIISFIWGGAKQEFELNEQAVRASLTAPTAPEAVAKPQKPEKPGKPRKPSIKECKELAAVDTEEDKVKIVKHIKRRETVAYLIMIVFTAFIGSIIAIIHYAKSKAQDFWKVCKQDSIKAANALAPIIIMGLITTIVTMSLLLSEGNPASIFKIDEQAYLKATALQANSVHGEMMSMYELEKDEYDIKAMSEAIKEVKVYHLGYAELKRLSKMSDDELFEHLMYRQNLWDLRVTYPYGDVESLDTILYIASADGIDNVVKGYEKNAKPMVDAINALNEYFNFDLTYDEDYFDFNYGYYANKNNNYENFKALCKAMCGEFSTTQQADDMVKISISRGSGLLSEEEYTQLENKLQAVPNAIKHFYESGTQQNNTSTSFDSIVRILWTVSFNPELTTRDAIAKWYSVYRLDRNDLAYDANIVLMFAMLTFFGPLIGIVYFLILWIFAIKLLKKSKQYTRQVLHGYYADYIEQKQLYEEGCKAYEGQLKAYKEYRKAYFNYLVELGYYEEGVPRKR